MTRFVLRHRIVQWKLGGSNQSIDHASRFPIVENGYLVVVLIVIVNKPRNVFTDQFLASLRMRPGQMLIKFLGVNSLKQDLSICTTFNPPLFSLDTTFNPS